MRSLIALIALVACIALANAGVMPKKYPYLRDRPTDTYYEYPLLRQDFDNYFQHNYVVPDRHEACPYFGYPYGECSSCRSYHTEPRVKPDCPCQQAGSN